MQSPVYVSDIIGIDFSTKEVEDIMSEVEEASESGETSEPDADQPEEDAEDSESSGDAGDGEEPSGEDGETPDGDGEEPEPVIGDKDDGEADTKKPVYFYYVSKDTLVKVNKNDPSDVEETKKAGSTNLLIDEENGVIYYIYLNRFIIRSPLNGGQLEYIVRSANKITSMVYDPRGGKLYFADSSGTIESYDVKTKSRTVLYRGRDNPEGLTLSPPNKMDRNMAPQLIWREGTSPEDSKIITAPSANPSNRDIVVVGRSPELTGSEHSISRTPKGDVYYFVRDDRVYKFTPETKSVEKVSDIPATSVIALPEGVLFTTEDNEVCGQTLERRNLL